MTKEELLKLTVKELRAMVVKLGMPQDDADLFEIKKPIIAVINTLSAKEAVDKTHTEDKNTGKKWLGKAEIMRDKLMKQPKVRILIPIEGKEKVGVVKWVFNPKSKRKEQVYIKGAYVPVQLNGFKWLIPKGVYQEVPEQIANVIAEAQQMTSEAGQDWLVDRDDPKLGGTVADRL